MKLVRFGPAGSERPGLVDGNGDIRDLSGVIGDITGAELAPERLAKLAGLVPAQLPLVEQPGRFGPPVFEGAVYRTT